MKDPLLQVMTSETLVAIKDKFPKAKHHFLVMPKEHINSIFEVRISTLYIYILSLTSPVREETSFIAG